MAVPPEQPHDASDDGYDEDADEDFNPDRVAGDDEASSSEDEDATRTVDVQAKRAQKRKGDEVDAELDSGDEVTIQERKRKRKRKADAAEDEGESGGEGGFVRTRAQRLAEKAERKERKRTAVGQVTIDVDQIWAELSKAPLGRVISAPRPTVSEEEGHPQGNGIQSNGQNELDKTNDTSDMVTVKRRIEYAGEISTITVTVPRDSKEARDYLRHHHTPSPIPSSDPEKPPLRRPLKRPSIFEPNPTSTIRGVPPEKLLRPPRAPNRLDVLMAQKRLQEAEKLKAEKMTTVQKSALDWQGFVEGQEGLREEMEAYGKSRGTFLEREEFLGRAELERERRGREARGMVG